MQLYRVRNLYCPLDHDEAYVRARAARELGVGVSRLAEYWVERRSIDARDKRDVRFVYTVIAGLESPSRSLGDKASEYVAEPRFAFPPPARKAPADGARPVVVGAGPAGLFCALALAEAGYRPVVLERGDPVESRGKAVQAFWGGAELDPESNMQFGEGGAGTYSDGKLTGSARDPAGRASFVIEAMIAAGAPKSIRYDAKPHVGTDYLVAVVKSLRARILSAGGEFRFRTRVDGLVLAGGEATGVALSDGSTIGAGAVCLAIGHSARDTFAALAKAGVPMERKPFAIGLRVEHPQASICQAQYGERWAHTALPPADYSLTHRAPDGRGVYTFCMCPGGVVVDASSEPGLSVCNGMSDHERSAPNANSAVVVAVRPEDFGGDDSSADGVMAGMEFQRRWERLAHGAASAALGAGASGSGARSAMPVETLGDFLAGRAPSRLGAVAPSTKGLWAPADLRSCLPAFVALGIASAFPSFDRRLAGFASPDAVLTGVETRTSSPIKIPRGERLESRIGGLFPCGEGAGYAGGIMSAAVDGLRVAEAIAARLGRG